ncbi:MAG: hypothetical protein KDD11_00640 [Acidobacteria bacterium]|nr:hypothetical protein [Acidobacteriota bacterium]
MKKIFRIAVPAFVLVVALTTPVASWAQGGSWTADTVVGPLPLPVVSVVGAGQTCEEAKANAKDALMEDYFLLKVTYGACLCTDVTDPWTGEYLTTLCSVKATAIGFRKLIALGP